MRIENLEHDDQDADQIQRFKDDPWLIAIAQSGDFELARLYMEAKQK